MRRYLSRMSYQALLTQACQRVSPASRSKKKPNFGLLWYAATEIATFNPLTYFRLSTDTNRAAMNVVLLAHFFDQT